MARASCRRLSPVSPSRMEPRSSKAQQTAPPEPPRHPHSRIAQVSGPDHTKTRNTTQAVAAVATAPRAVATTLLSGALAFCVGDSLRGSVLGVRGRAGDGLGRILHRVDGRLRD